MRRLILAFMLIAAPAAAQQHADIVANTKATLEARGVNLSGPCGAFAITKHVAWALRGEQAGLLDKPAGNNCEGYATDIIMYPDGRIFDILADAGGSNGPMWGGPDLVDATRYRLPVDPGDVAPQPQPLPAIDLAPVMTGLQNVGNLEAQLLAAVAKLQADLDAHAAKEESHWAKASAIYNQIARYALPAVGALLGLKLTGGK